jgi:hypothetical protein
MAGYSSQVHVTLLSFFNSNDNVLKIFINSSSNMVQGKTKGLQTKESSARHAKKAAANMKKGRVVIAPKKTVLVKQAALQKVNLVPHSPSYLLLNSPRISQLKLINLLKIKWSLRRQLGN